MMSDRKEFRANEYMRSFEKSLNYMFGAILAICVICISIYFSTGERQWTDLWAELDAIHRSPRNALRILAAVLSTLPYYCYYTLKDNTDWNARNGRKDDWGLAKAYFSYEIGIMILFYLLLQGGSKSDENAYIGSKLIVAFIGAAFTIIYIVILICRHIMKRERIGYFIAVIFMMFLFFGALFLDSFNRLKDYPEQDYRFALFLLSFLGNSAVNIFFLHRFDSCEKSGIIANRIKIIIPVLSISVYTSSLIYCWYSPDAKNDLKIMAIVALWITAYEIVISCIKCHSVSVKIMWCIISFMVFIIGLPILIWRYIENRLRETITGLPVLIWSHIGNDFRKEMILKWFLIIGICIYFVAAKYFGSIIKLLFQQKETEEAKAKLMNTVIWFRNSILGSMLFILVIVMESHLIMGTPKYFLLLVTIIPLALIEEFYVYRYVFNNSKRTNDTRAYAAGRTIEFLAVLLPLIAFIIEHASKNRLTGYLPDGKNVLAVVAVACVIVTLMGLCLYIASKFDKGEWVRLPELEKRQVLKEVWNYLRHVRTLTANLLSDKNAENFWMAVLTWGMYITLSAISLYVFPFDTLNNPDFGLVYKIPGIGLMLFIIEVDWIFLSRDLLNYYMEKMKEGEDIMKCKKMFETEWTKCLKDLHDFKESDAKQFQGGEYYRPIFFYFGATYNYNDDLTEDDYKNIAKASCSIELIHKAAAMIDDYLDEDDIRNNEESFHQQYSDPNTLILLRNSMQAKAQVNFAQCRSAFLCNDDVMINNMQRLAQIIYDTNLGHYRELSLATYDRLRAEEVNEINFMETVSFFKECIGLGYSCFHEFQGTNDHQDLERLGIAFGHFYQCINDLDPFSQKERYENFKGVLDKGVLDNFGKKNTALLRLYHHLTKEEKNSFPSYKYNTIIKLYHEYCIEQEILDEIKETVSEISSILKRLTPGNEKWVTSFKTLFNYILDQRRWRDKIPEL